MNSKSILLKSKSFKHHSISFNLIQSKSFPINPIKFNSNNLKFSNNRFYSSNISNIQYFKSKVEKRNSKFLISKRNFTQKIDELSKGDAAYTCDASTYSEKASEILEDIYDSVERELEDADDDSFVYDINFEDGVLTIGLGKHGTYVINKQVPNRQLWWSSPLSGPKRFQFNEDKDIWENVRDPEGEPHLTDLLSQELKELINLKVEF